MINDEESLYLKEDKVTKIGFSCIMVNCERFMVILIEKSNFVFLIDANETFHKLDMFSTWPKHGFKIP
jgi:hypothetical protein